MGMNAQDIARYLQARPFRPFRVSLTDGRSYLISHPEMMMLERTSAEIGIPSRELSHPIFDHIVTVSLLHVMEIERLPQKDAS